MATATRLTPDDLLAMPGEGRGFELIDGELREKVMSNESSWIGGEVFGLLRDYTKPRKLGLVFPNDQAFQCFAEDPERVRRPDASFIRVERMKRGDYLNRGYCRIVPDLVVEVVSPNDANSAVHDKRIDWLKAGVRLVVVIDPGDETIHICSDGNPPRHFNTVDVLDFEPVLMGFTMPAMAVFEPPPLAD